ncbi:hypothetical protein ACQ4PT_061147 [Festuca glaucescens]
MDNVLRGLTSANVIGAGSAGVVYRLDTPNGYPIAVKKMWSPNEAPAGMAFHSEIALLGSFCHRNIMRLLGVRVDAEDQREERLCIAWGRVSGDPDGTAPARPDGAGRGAPGIVGRGAAGEAWRRPRQAPGARLRGSPGEADEHEMRQVLAVAVPCVSHLADDRPAMKDVVALLEEIRRPDVGPWPTTRSDLFAISDYTA